MADLRAQFEKLSLDFSSLQSDLNNFFTARSKLETQFQENKIVLEELESIDENSKVYKLTGPVLMPQDYSEAKGNVEKRIDFIRGEIDRVELKISTAQKSIESTRDEILKVRTSLNS